MYLYLLEKKIPRYVVALVVAVMFLSLGWAKISEVKVLVEVEGQFVLKKTNCD